MSLSQQNVPSCTAPSSTGNAGLLDRLRARRPGAFEELLDLYQRPIHGFVYRLLDDPADAPDVTQEVFIKVFCKISGFRGDCSLKSWLYRIAMNEALNRRRWFRRHRRPEMPMESVDGVSGPTARGLADESQSPFDLTYRREQMALVEQALRQIDERLRCAVLLRDVEGHSYNEIAEMLQVSLGTVKSRILRGREALKRGLQRHLPAQLPDGAALQTE